MSVNEKMTALADAIRSKTGGTEKLTIDQMTADVTALQVGGGDDSFKAVIERTATNPTLPSDLTSIGTYAFAYCTNLESISLPNGVTSIGSNAFYECSNLESISLPSDLKSIGDSVFYKCTNLALTSLPNGVTSIGNNAFYACGGITEITFEGTPKSIASSAFNQCTKLLTINVPWAEGAVSGAPWGATNATINYNYTGG